jgi:ubiquinone/menaquinone biosynthesis C-methylase UbiE
MSAFPVRLSKWFKNKKQVFQNILQDRGNKVVYESEDVVKVYASQCELKKPEETILNEIRHQLPNMRMLDIGVGGGRTTIHFAHLAKEYTGIDYSHEMVKICCQRFKEAPKNISFVTVDARNLESFRDSQFDFVLFSFNGIDYVNHEDRMRIFEEIHRVLKKGGYFCFSTHNLNYASTQCSIHLTRHPTRLAKEVTRLILMRLINRKVWRTLRKTEKNQLHLNIKTGAHDFRLATYFITPKEQLKQLGYNKFNTVKTYSMYDGEEMEAPTNALDPELYFFATAE